MRWIRLVLPVLAVAIGLAVSTVPAFAIGGQIPCSRHGHIGVVVYHHSRPHCRT